MPIPLGFVDEVVLGVVVVDCPTVLPGVVPIVVLGVPAVPPVCVFCEPSVLDVFAVVPAPVLVLLPPMPEPVEPAVCAPAQAKAASIVGARSHVRFIVIPSMDFDCKSGIRHHGSPVRVPIE